MKIVLMFLSAAVISTQGCAFASGGASEPLAYSVQEGVSFSRYSKPRIGDVAPEFSFPQVEGDKIWSSRDVLGRQSVVLLLVSPSLIKTGRPTDAVLSLVAKAAEQLQKEDVRTVAVSTQKDAKLEGLNSSFDKLLLRDGRGALGAVYSLEATPLTVVGIDRAGFLRRLEVVRDPASVADIMLDVGDSTPALEVGKLAPDFAIPDMNGRVRRLSELRGRRNLLLTFFPKCFTGGCASHLSSLQSEGAAFAKAETDIWAVSVDPAEGEEGQLAFAEHLGLMFPLVPDTSRSLSMLYGTARKPYSTALRYSMLIDKTGILRFVDKRVQVLTHGPDMLVKMHELGMAR